MIDSEHKFKRAMRRMIKRIINGQSPLPDNPSREDYEVLTECIKAEYILSLQDEDLTIRTMDGCPHPVPNCEVIPLKGLAFLKPDKAELYARISIWLSIFALLISVLTNLTEIVQNVRLLIGL